MADEEVPQIEIKEEVETIVVTKTLVKKVTVVAVVAQILTLGLAAVIAYGVGEHYQDTAFVGRRLTFLPFPPRLETAISGLKRSIDGVYLYSSLSGIQPTYNETTGQWGISTFDIPDRGSLPHLVHFRTLAEPGLGEYVVKDDIDAASWYANGTLTPYNYYTQDVNDTSPELPFTSESLCLWSKGGTNQATVFLRCANTHGNIHTYFYISGVDTVARTIQQVEGHSIEAGYGRGFVLKALPVDDIGTYKTVFTKIAALPYAT